MNKFLKKANNEFWRANTMELLWEIILFIIYSMLIVAISKYILVPVLRKFAESINLKAKTVGNLAGLATSVPELLSVSFASVTGLMGTSIYNIISSNVINLIQYAISVGINKNGKMLRNKALLIDLAMVIITIIIPIWFAKTNIETNLFAVFIMIALFIFFHYINHNTHKLYLQNIETSEDVASSKAQEISSKRNIIIKYSIYLILTGIALFFVGNLLSGTLENLCNRFNVPEIVVGIALGFITSIPELITFFEAQKHHKSKENEFLGVVEATNNLLASNTLNLFVIHSIGIILYRIFW
jgi:Ca2+/Na+ antiporter